MQGLPRQDGKTIVITGANAGIGKVTALRLAEAGARVVIAGRSRERTAPVLEAINSMPGSQAPAFVQMDLTSLADVRRAADELLAICPAIDVLIANAGLAGQRGATKDGFELAFGVNHLGHYLFTRLLWERIAATEQSRVVLVASRAHFRAPGLDFEAVQQTTRTTTAFPEYCTSKLCNVLFAAELRRRQAARPSPHVPVMSLHPGVVATEIWRHIPGPLAWIAKQFMITEEQGARTTLYCATSQDLGAEPALYYDDCKAKRVSKLAQREDLARELWERSAAWVGLPDAL